MMTMTSNTIRNFFMVALLGLCTSLSERLHELDQGALVVVALDLRDDPFVAPVLDEIGSGVVPQHQVAEQAPQAFVPEHLSGDALLALAGAGGEVRGQRPPEGRRQGLQQVVEAMGVAPSTAFGASIATLSNVGPGFGQVGPTSTYAPLPEAAKVILAFGMLLGRLELFTVLVVLTPMFWKRR
jgi:hypothetical protein